MEYKRLDDTRLLVRLDPGDEIIKSLAAVAQQEKIRSEERRVGKECRL